MSRQIHPSLLASGAVALCLVLSACGSSDLDQLQDERLDDAIAESNTSDGVGGDTSDETDATGPTDVGAEGDGTGSTTSDSDGDESGGDSAGGDTEGSGNGSGADSASEPNLGAAFPAVLDQNDYQLVFSDEFDAESLDATRWSTTLPWGANVIINDEQQYYVDALGNPDFGHSPFTLSDGVLTISATETPDDLRTSANQQSWLSGALSTAGKFEYTYGYAEARISMPEGKGVWPSIWMLAPSVEGLRPQLAVMERDGSRTDSVFYNYEYNDEEDQLRSPGQFEVEQDGLSDGFHTVGVSWSPEEFLFFLDGEPRYRIIGDNVSAQDMYLNLSLAIGGTWPGMADETTPVPVEWLLDYVRVWQRTTP